MKKILNRVTVTGADDGVHPEDLVALSQDFPFVEWGILVSQSAMGKARFPTLPWLMRLADCHRAFPMQLSAHVCGKWVRDICKGDWTINETLKEFLPVFERIQLNFHAEVQHLDQHQFLKGLEEKPFEFIFQLDDVNDNILDIAVDQGICAAGLFDKSGGAGVLPGEWPVTDKFAGYAGGLSPENVQEQLEKIELVCNNGPIWIDVETRVRSDDNSEFDLNKVRSFLEAAQPWVI